MEEISIVIFDAAVAAIAASARGLTSRAERRPFPGAWTSVIGPAIVEEKSRVGDWELDTIVGSQRKGALVSIVGEL